MARITTTAGFTGQVGSVRFTRGVGETDNPGMLAYFARHSDLFTIDPEWSEDEHDEGQDPAGLDGESEGDGQDEHDEADPMDDPYAVSVAELRKLCGERGIPQAGSKAELQDRLRSYDDEHAPSDAE